MDFLKGWTTNLVIFIIIISFLEMILPDGNMRRFVKMTIGLIIILVIINPFIKLVQGDIDIEKEVFKNIESQYNYREGDQIDFAIHQNELIEEIYIEEIKTALEQDIINQTNYMLGEGDIEIDQNKDTKNYGNIEKMILTLREKDDEKNKSEKKPDINKVETIKVDVTIKHQNKDEKNNNEDEEYTNSKTLDDIKEKISTKFQISKEKIFIKLDTKE